MKTVLLAAGVCSRLVWGLDWRLAQVGESQQQESDSPGNPRSFSQCSMPHGQRTAQRV